MTWEAATSALLALHVGQRLRHADGSLVHVRAVLAEDERAVVRQWSPGKQSWIYDVIAASALAVGLYKAEARR